MHTQLIISHPPNPTLHLAHTPRVAELIFVALVAIPGPLIWLYLADSHLWGILATFVFVFLASQFLPPSAHLRVTDRTLSFTFYPYPLAQPRIHQASRLDVNHIQLRTVPMPQVSKNCAGTQILVVFNEGFGIPTTDTLAVGNNVVSSIESAAKQLAQFLNVQFQDNRNLPGKNPSPPSTPSPSPPTSASASAISSSISKSTPTTTLRSRD